VGVNTQIEKCSQKVFTKKDGVPAENGLTFTQTASVKGRCQKICTTDNNQSVPVRLCSDLPTGKNKRTTRRFIPEKGIVDLPAEPADRERDKNTL
jgi:hypothetical protein